MASESERHKAQKEWFMAGYNEMLRQIEPERIICYNTPFPEMQGNIVYVDYDRSSWRYMNYERSLPKDDLDCYKIGGAIQPKHDIMEPYRIGKGGGSAFGGKWKPSPNKPEDQRYLGEPGSTKTTTMRNGDVYQTKIGSDGRAEMERHNTDHGKPWAHTNPHDHKIEWVDPPGYPDPQSPINYPDGAPEFKQYGVVCYMKNTIVPTNTTEQNRFETISDFKTCMRYHGETEFIWKGITYSVTHYNGMIAISHSRRQDTEMQRKTADEILEYIVGEDRLRDVITQVTVLYRTI